MVKDSIAFIANYLWRESIKNLHMHLTEAEIKNFSSNDYYYLTTIYYMGKPNFSQVAEALNVTKPAVSAMIRKLSKMGLIEKIQSQEDKRVYYVSVTEKGKNIVEGDEKLYKKIDLQIKECLGSDHKYEFLETLLAEIVRYLQKTDR
ncbi:MarR family winged helix-turn-helix transcriptional regulator [Aeribacillus composti]|uniref:MarR family winged helix-turn-helix transcriptional regulator n=1 Tax=Aeribacillus composti TaxID=1868734 RepID=A0ABY9W916_9BACI|nr:MarR family winged helix-turn-helix transcriptional regulator [Aeribacillus composti]WNF32634.1 MarR family winged helix-turn-helix transcriptional regulator [Aeribacillus composti]